MLKNLSVLYAEEEEFIRKNTIEVLEFMSMKVTAVSNGEDAYKKYLKIKPDIIISDIEIPILSGLDLVEKIRKEDRDTQIIILTKHTKIEYFLKAVQLNLVKYLLKPASLNELKNALITCTENIERRDEKLNKYFNTNDFYNLPKKYLKVNNKTVKLDFHEREFLELLLENNNRVVSYPEIEKKIWKKNMSSAAIRSLVRNLRKKLPNNTIENISKIGYKVNIL